VKTRVREPVLSEPIRTCSKHVERLAETDSPYPVGDVTVAIEEILGAP